jgi:prepilin-type N-terminal cleavage/methylation domain-containing protein
VDEATNKADQLPAAAPTRRDRGVSFIELLVAIVLLGTVIVAVLTALRATVIATTVERDHSKSQQWLQSAVGVLEAAPFGDCTATTAAQVPTSYNTIRTDYENSIRSLATRPEGFVAPAQISVTSIDVWNGTAYTSFTSQAECLDNNDLRQQLVTISARNTSGKITETVEVVKRDG